MMNQTTDLRWWAADKGNRHEVAAQVLRRIKEQQSYQAAQDLHHARLYGDMPSLGLGPWAFQRLDALSGPRLSLNVVKSCVDTLQSKVCRNEVRPMVVTERGDWALKSKSERMQRFIDGQFYASDVGEVAPDVFRDAGIFGVGLAKIYGDEDERGEWSVCVERTLPSEITVSDAESFSSAKPRSLFQRKPMDRLVAAEKWPKKREEIMDCPPLKDDDDVGLNAYDRTADLIVVSEAWHLPSGPNAKDGRHIIFCENATLFEEPWTRPEFPFAVMRVCKGLVGWRGVGLAADLTGIQIEINRLLADMQEAHHIICNPRIAVENGSKVVDAHIDDQIGSILRYTGTPPQVLAFPAFSPEVYTHLWNLYAKAFEISGISQMSAGGMKPAGLNSGKALETFTDIATERFSVVSRNYERWHVDVARQMIYLARQRSKEDPSYSVRFRDTKAFEYVRFVDADTGEDAAILQVWPTNAFARDPSAKMQQVFDAAQNGAFGDDPREVAKTVRRLLNFPDLAADSARRDASYNRVQEILKPWLDPLTEQLEYTPPDNAMELPEAVFEIMRPAYNESCQNKMPEERLALIRQWMVEAVALMTQQATPPSGQPAPPIGPPPGEDLQDGGGAMTGPQGAGPLPVPGQPPAAPPPLLQAS